MVGHEPGVRRSFAKLVLFLAIITSGLFNSSPAIAASMDTNQRPSVRSYQDVTYAISVDGTLWAWGVNNSGQLGIGSTEDRRIPSKVMDHVQSVVSARDFESEYGGRSTFAITDDGVLWGWGDNESGKLGNGSEGIQTSPVRIMDGVASVSTQGSITFAIKHDGSLWGWGGNGSLLGDGTEGEQRTPKLLMYGAKDVLAGSMGGIYVIKSDSSLWAWGSNWHGSLGVGSWAGSYLYPEHVLDDVALITTDPSGWTVYAIGLNGSLWAWGDNQFSQLGDGATQHRNAPFRVMNDAVSIDAGNSNAYAIKADGSLWAWGNNDAYGSVGDGTFTNRRKPVKIMDDVSAVVGYDVSALAIRTDGSLWTWGGNREGQLGREANWSSPSPAPILSQVLRPMTTSSESRGRGFAFKQDGSLWAWGQNGDGWLGDGSTENRYAPVMILGPNGQPTFAEYLVRFEVNGGTAVEPQSVNKGGLVKRPDDPALSGYVFRGWYSDETLTRPYDFASPVAGDLTLYAKWERVSSGFADVPLNHWVVSQGWLDYATAHGLMSGYNGNFAPDGPLTRGQVAAVLYRIANPDSDATTNPGHYGADTGFADGGSQRYYFAAVKWLKEQGVSTGDKDARGRPLNRFRPDDQITRQELAAMVFRFAGIQGADTSSRASIEGFHDAWKVDGYAREPLSWCLAEGVITGGQGSTAGQLFPRDTATRAQAAKIFTVVHRDVLKK